MKKSLVRIKENSFILADVSIKKNIFKVYEIKEYEDKELFLNEIKKRKNFFISFLPSEIIKKEISINSNIKNKNTIEKIIEFNLKKDLKEEFIFNFSLKEKNEIQNQNIYFVEAIKKKDIDKNIVFFQNKKNIELITTDYHSLQSHYMKLGIEDAFIATHIENNRIIYIACFEKKMIFFRESNLFIENPLLKSEIIASDISRTVLFIKQQNRGIDFKNLYISGDIYNNEQIFYNLSGIDTKISVPLNFTNDLNNEQFLNHFILLGLAYLEKKYNFEPIEIKKEKQFNIISNALFIIFIFPIIFYLYIDLSKYFDILKKEELIKEKKERIFILEKNLKILDLKDLEYYNEYIENLNNSFQKEILSDLAVLEPLIRVLIPIKVESDETTIKVTFFKRFDSLNRLMRIKKEFEKILDKMKKRDKIVNKSTLDFENLEFKAILVLNRKKSKK